MTNLTTNSASILKPEQVGPLIVEPITKESTAFQVSTVVHTSSHEYRIPRLTGDPATGWVAEGAEIGIDDADLDELTVVPKKCAGITVISNELAADSSPEASAVISQRLVNSLRRSIDAAWFGNTVANGPSGLGSITPSHVYAGAAYADLDAFLEAQAVAEDQGVAITSWVTSPQTALELAKLKESDTSNRGLLEPNATSVTGRTVAGVPLYTSPDAPDDGTVFGVVKPVTFAVIRKDPEVTVDSSAFFTSDRVAVRAVVRVAFGFPFAGAIVRVHRTAHP
jgi:HK97 family phage major capsid protein